MKVLIVGLLTGIGAGILAGLVGVGGGLVVVPALVFFFGMDQHTAQGTSLAVLLPPTGLFAFLRYYQSGHVDMRKTRTPSVMDANNTVRPTRSCDHFSSFSLGTFPPTSTES